MALIAKNFGSNNAYTVQLEWEPTAQIVESNVTNVHLKCSIKSNRSGASFNGEGRTDTLTVNEISYSIPHGSYTVPGGGSVTFWEYDIAVSHDSDGSFNSKPISCAVNIDNTFSSSGHIGIVTPSGTMTLTTIPRASTMSISGSEIGKPVTFTISAASTNFTHSLTYEFGGATGTIISYAKAGTYTWTPPASLVEKCTDAKSNVVKYKLYTWSGTASAIGTKDFEATLSVPASYAPNVTDGWAMATPYNAATAAADIAAFVQGYSRALVEFNPSKIELHGGATIKGYKISYAGVTNSAAPHMTGVLNGTSAEITCTVEDTRGYTASAVLNVSVYPYSNPKLTDISLYRSDPDGAADSAGSCIYAKATLVYSDIGGLNECPLNAYYRLQGGDYGSAIALSSAYGSVITDLAPATNTYVAKIAAKDSLGNSVFYEATIPTDKVAFHLARGGKGAAFGKYCEKDNLLDIAWDARFRGNVTFDKGVPSSNAVNLLDNSDFSNPVNQRGIADGAVITNAYWIDRWKIMNRGSVSFGDGFITISANQNYPVYLRQILEKGVRYPCTFVCRTVDGVYSAVFKSGGTVTFENGAYVQHSTATQWDIVIPTGSSLSIKNIEVYDGEYPANGIPNYQPKGYRAELAACQRYFYAIRSGSTYTKAGMGIAESSGKFYPNLQVPVPLKSRPEITYSGGWKVWDGTTAINISEMTINTNSIMPTDCSDISFSITAASSLTAGKVYVLANRNDTTAYLWLSADL